MLKRIVLLVSLMAALGFGVSVFAHTAKHRNNVIEHSNGGWRICCHSVHWKSNDGYYWVDSRNAKACVAAVKGGQRVQASDPKKDSKGRKSVVNPTAVEGGHCHEAEVFHR